MPPNECDAGPDADLVAQLAAKDARITEQDAVIAAQATRIGAQEARIAQLEKQVADLPDRAKTIGFAQLRRRTVQLARGQTQRGASVDIDAPGFAATASYKRSATAPISSAARRGPDTRLKADRRLAGPVRGVADATATRTNARSTAFVIATRRRNVLPNQPFNLVLES